MEEGKTNVHRRLEVIDSGNTEADSCKTFVMHNEDHTLGNSLRYIIMKNSDVQFCGYTVPHPSENKINFRVQTYGKPAVDILRKGLEDLNKMCEHVLQTFENSVSEFKESQPEDVEMSDQ
ncbi:hypothetical protein SNE40_016554 [Patella caerulea]|uniref:DNA-directed RNA polymerases I and III subunit RPAC2 n=1 Tax=Patella caerulea TaxID=87958 RepID=A0AAN8JEE3_PATCE